MVISFANGFRESYAIDYGCMIQSITNDCIFRAENSLEKSCISVETAWKQNTVLKFVVLCNDLLQIFMNVLSSANKSD